MYFIKYNELGKISIIEAEKNPEKDRKFREEEMSAIPSDKRYWTLRADGDRSEILHLDHNFEPNFPIGEELLSRESIDWDDVHFFDGSFFCGRYHSFTPRSFRPEKELEETMQDFYNNRLGRSRGIKVIANELDCMCYDINPVNYYLLHSKIACEDKRCYRGNIIKVTPAIYITCLLERGEFVRALKEVQEANIKFAKIMNLYNIVAINETDYSINNPEDIANIENSEYLNIKGRDNIEASNSLLKLSKR